MGGVCGTEGYGGSSEETTAAKFLDAELKKLNNDDMATIKILLLGAGECGKSTILKQMKILHQGGFDDAEKKEKMPLVRSNTVDSMAAMIVACRSFQIPFDDPTAEQYAEDVLAWQMDRTSHRSREAIQQLGEKLQVLWKNESIQTVFCERTSEFHLLDSAPYFLNHIQRCFATEYLPTEQDIIRTRLATVGIIESNFFLDKKVFKFFDVGGQRGERKKWIHCFEGVRAILFIASLSEYDQVLEEDRTRNRMQESLKLFESIINLSWFAETPIILFLNKADIFRKKIMKTDMGIYFSSYLGGLDHELGVLFIKEQYFAKNQNEDKTIYVHITDATDTTHFSAVWVFTKHIVLQRNLSRAGLVL